MYVKKVIRIFPASQARSTPISRVSIGVESAGSHQKVIANILKNVSNFPLVLAMILNSVLSIACKKLIIELLSSPNSVKNATITTQASGAPLCKPGIKSAIIKDNIMMIVPDSARKESTFPEIFSISFGLFWCLESSRTVMVYSPRSAITAKNER